MISECSSCGKEVSDADNMHETDKGEFICQSCYEHLANQADYDESECEDTIKDDIHAYEERRYEDQTLDRSAHYY